MTMKNKFILPGALLCLALAPGLVQAQTPVAVAKVAQEPMPKAQELLDNLFAPYAAAKTFRGNFDITLDGDDPKNTLNAISEFHLQTRFRFNDKGDLAGQDETLQIIGKGHGKESQTFRFADDGRASFVVFIDQKAWSKVGQRDAVPASIALLKPIVDAVIQGVNQAVDKTPGAVLVVSDGVEAGRPVWILTAQNSNVLRVVVDAQTRALRSLNITNERQEISIRGSQQEFNAPFAADAFDWAAPAGFKRVPLGSIALPPSLTISMTGADSQQK